MIKTVPYNGRYCLWVLSTTCCDALPEHKMDTHIDKTMKATKTASDNP